MQYLIFVTEKSCFDKIRCRYTSISLVFLPRIAGVTLRSACWPPKPSILSSPHSGGYSDAVNSVIAQIKLSSPRSGGYSVSNSMQIQNNDLSSPRSGGYSDQPLTKNGSNNFLPRVAGVTLKKRLSNKHQNHFLPRIAGVTPPPDI